MNKTTGKFSPGGIDNEGDVKDGDVSSLLKIVVIVTFINQYKKYIQCYTTLDLPTLLWKKSHSLFYCYSINSTLKVKFKEPTSDIWGVDTIPFPSCDWIL